MCFFLVASFLIMSLLIPRLNVLSLPSPRIWCRPPENPEWTGNDEEARSPHRDEAHGVADLQGVGLPLSDQVLTRRPSLVISAAIVGTICLFLVSATAQQVSIQVHAHEDEGNPSNAVVGGIYDFSMVTVLRDFWGSRCYILAFLVCTWSMVWPLVKLVLMLLCWRTPPRRLRPVKRGIWLRILDQAGRLSLFDPFLFTMFLVGLRVGWDGADLSSNADSNLRIMAVPHIGYYMLFLGTVLSLLIGEFILWCHRQTVEVKVAYNRSDVSESTLSVDEEPSPFCSAIFTTESPDLKTPTLPILPCVDMDKVCEKVQQVENELQSRTSFDVPVYDLSTPRYQIHTPPIVNSTSLRSLAMFDRFLTGAASVVEEEGSCSTSTPRSPEELKFGPSSHNNSTHIDVMRATSQASSSAVQSQRSGMGRLLLDGAPDCSPLSGSPPFCTLPQPLWKALGISKSKRYFILSLLVVSALLTPCVIIFDSYSYTWGGLIGGFKVLIEEPTETRYSILSLLFGTFYHYGDGYLGWFAGALIFVLFGFLVVVAPLLYVFALLGVWVLPMTHWQQSRALEWVQLLNAWSCMDVLAAALFFSMLGGQTFGIASFLRFVTELGTVRPVCDAVLTTFNVHCVEFSPDLLGGAYLMLVCALLHIATGQLVCRQVKQEDLMMSVVV